ncbi:RNA helicase [Entomophthora muscae]|uniref:RNA helicase n=1 Tax=Entomophthora muscae TaxID=34485 RepID=A0ACC2S7M0_9FUNG|nr:RNA helicase [Entomophthora muscae]
MHVGPTKSEKTIQALKRLQASNRGIYCGPLRLMAYEVWKRFVDEGLSCDLVTGEERISATDYFVNPKKFNDLESVIQKRDSIWKSKRRVSPLLDVQKLVSATTEMLCVDTLYDVAVIDEIQLLGDQQRGWAWTRALLGVQAHEVHLCGGASAVPIVQDICRELNEEVVINEYPRLSPLKPNPLSMRSFYASVKRGDCFVTASRSDIFKHKDAIERVTGIRCAVIYDQLPAGKQVNATANL